jgi:hypothetical protein
MPINHDEIRRLIETKCRQRGWNAFELGKRAHVAPNAIRKYIIDKQPISNRAINQLLKTLQLPTTL